MPNSFQVSAETVQRVAGSASDLTSLGGGGMRRAMRMWRARVAVSLGASLDLVTLCCVVVMQEQQQEGRSEDF